MYEVKITADEARQTIQDILIEEKNICSEQYQPYIDTILEDIEFQILRTIERKHNDIVYMYDGNTPLSFDVVLYEVKKSFEKNGFSVIKAWIEDSIRIGW